MYIRLPNGHPVPVRTILVPLLFLVALAGGLLVPWFLDIDTNQPLAPITIGSGEPVALSNPSGDELVEVLAKIDTGAESSSIDTRLAQQLGLDLENADKVTVKSSLGEEKRPVVDVQLQVAGQILNTRVTVNDRSGLSSKMLLGARDLDGFLVDVGNDRLTTPYEAPTTVVATPNAPLPHSTSMLLATIPLAAALVVGSRTLIGVQTFGVFAPMLLALALTHSGFVPGIAMFGLIIAAGTITQILIQSYKLPRIARLAVLLAGVVLTLLIFQDLTTAMLPRMTWASTFPVVVMACIIERFWLTWEQDSLLPALKLAGWTLVVAVATAALLMTSVVQLFADRMPLALVLLGGALSLLIGTYRGLRLTEVLRFQRAATTEVYR